MQAELLVEVTRAVADALGSPGRMVLLVRFEGRGDGALVAGQDETSEIAWAEPSRWHRFAPPRRRL